MANKLIEAIARWLCEERDPGIMLTDPGYWTRYKPEAMELIAVIDKAGMVVVPKEPTREMLLAARDWSVAKYGMGVGNDGASGCYRAMLAATPQGRE